MATASTRFAFPLATDGLLIAFSMIFSLIEFMGMIGAMFGTWQGLIGGPERIGLPLSRRSIRGRESNFCGSTRTQAKRSFKEPTSDLNALKGGRCRRPCP